jgi:flagellar biosynthesis protein FlhF
MKDRVDMPTREIQVLKKEIKAMIDSVAARPAPAPAMADFASPGALPQDLRALHASLLELDLDADLAAELAYASRQTPLPEAMAARIRTTGGVRLRPGKPSVVAMVGPTGAGKTTTLCKLAALARMQQGKRVGILSADNFRMGAGEQLELFGRTAGIPVRPLFSVADVGPALKEFSGCDLILMDTAGRSHSHPEAWVELQNLLRAVKADEIHLALSTTTRMRELVHQAGLYGNLCRLAPACGVVFTKLDECVSLGCLYNLARRLDAPVSYLCDGQVIPDHIALATPRAVAARVLDAGRQAAEAMRTAAPATVPG